VVLKLGWAEREGFPVSDMAHTCSYPWLEGLSKAICPRGVDWRDLAQEAEVAILLRTGEGEPKKVTAVKAMLKFLRENRK